MATEDVWCDDCKVRHHCTSDHGPDGHGGSSICCPVKRAARLGVATEIAMLADLFRRLLADPSACRDILPNGAMLVDSMLFNLTDVEIEVLVKNGACRGD